MDTRTGLPDGTQLSFTNAEQGAVCYTVHRELGRGGSCIVYDASYTNNTRSERRVRVKECYPFKLRLSRAPSGKLLPAAGEEDRFAAQKEKFRAAFQAENVLFDADGITNSVSNTIDIYTANNTLYIVTTYAQGTALSAYPCTSLRECVSIVKSTAAVIGRIHEQGFLYLDCKPENIFILNETTELVQLFDFDTLFPMRGAGKDGDRISCTKGFAALELQMGSRDRLGPHTDVYGVGALLFYLLFGRTASAPDCARGAVYDFSRMAFSGENYPDRLFPALTDFFHRTLANSPADRYSGMGPVLHKLAEIAAYADTAAPFILSSRVNRPGLLIGREAELARLEDFFAQDECSCLFLTGVGGIGKSTLIRGYIAAHRDSFDTVLYLCYHDSVQRTIADDSQLRINTVRRLPEEELADYFQRKRQVLRDLTAGKRAVLVMDNFEAVPDADFLSLLEVGWKLVAVTRRSLQASDWIQLSLGAIAERGSLYRLFACHLGREIGEDRRAVLDDIIDRVGGHTLVLELIAKQAAASRMSLPEVAALAGQYGFSNLSPADVAYVKDQLPRRESVEAIISALFDSSRLSEEQRAVMKVLSLLPLSGIERAVWLELMPEGMDPGELIRDSWVQESSGRLSLHPVIRETVMAWLWEENGRSAAYRLMDGIREKGLFALAPEVLQTCSQEPALRSSEPFRSLLCETILQMTRDDEAFILAWTGELAEEAPYSSNMALYDKAASIYAQKGDFDSAAVLLKQARRAARRGHSRYLTGKYYDLEAGFYDERLGGAYDEGLSNRDYRRLLRALDRAVRNMERADEPDSRNLLARYMLSKSILMTRGQPERRAEIRELLDRVTVMVEDGSATDPEARYGYHMGFAWYYTYSEPKEADALRWAEAGGRLAEQKAASELDLIDELIIPRANILAEWKRYGEADDWLRRGVRICEEKREYFPYLRKKLELYRCLLDLWYYAGDFDRCRTLLDRLDREYGTAVDIPPALREAVEAEARTC